MTETMDCAMPNAVKMLTILGLAAVLAGCGTMREGGLSRVVPPSAGALALGNGLIGEAGTLKLSAEARSKALDAEFQALQFAPAGQEVAWTAQGFQGSVVPTQLYRIGSQDCRGYSHSVVASGRPVKETGTACRGEDGFWKTVV